jgi:hypothetical protein
LSKVLRIVEIITDLSIVFLNILLSFGCTLYPEVGGTSLDINVAPGATVIELLVRLYWTLLVLRVDFCVLDRGYYVLDRVGWVNKDHLAVAGLVEGLNASKKTRI